MFVFQFTHRGLLTPKADIGVKFFAISYFYICKIKKIKKNPELLTPDYTLFS